jgi:hypothetical protein
MRSAGRQRTGFVGEQGTPIHPQVGRSSGSRPLRTQLGKRDEISAIVLSFSWIHTPSVKEVHNLVSRGILSNNYDMLGVQDPANIKHNDQRMGMIELTRGSYPRCMSRD